MGWICECLRGKNELDFNPVESIIDRFLNTYLEKNKQL